MAKKWNIETACQSIIDSGQTISRSSKTVKVYKPPGIKVWGAIDFLCNHHGFSVSRDTS